MHRDEEGFVRVPRAGAEGALFDALEKGWQLAIDQNLAAVDCGDVAQTWVEKPSVNLTLRVRFDDVFRAVAKTAFNLMALKLGDEFALRTEFDPLRRYIRGIEIVHPPRAPGQVLVDGRFVAMSARGTPPIVPTDEHAITLAYVPPTLYAWVTLYASHNFVVRLAAVHMSDGVPTTHEFSVVRRGNEALGVQDVFDRVATRRALQ
jgi:hypothetical protein